MILEKNSIKIGLATIGFLSVAISNHLMIFNEETVVAVCFVSFMVFSFQFFGKSVQESLDERNIAIKTEFLEALLLEKKYCQQIMYEHQAPRAKTGAFLIMTKEMLRTKMEWYKHFRQQYLPIFLEQSLIQLVDTKMNYRQRQLLVSKKMFEEKWYNLMSSKFEGSVLSEFQTTREQQKEMVLAQSIKSVEKELTYKK